MSKPEVPRTKVNAVAIAELEAWVLGTKAAEKIARACIEARAGLLEAGFPDGNALCEELDKDTAKWTARATQMLRDMRHHIEVNKLTL
jgi:hypothetical protein